MTVEDKKGTENPSLFCVSNSDDEVKIHHLGRVMEDADDRLRMEEPEKQMFTPREQELLQAIVTLNRIASLDSTEYQERLRKNALPSVEHPQLLKLTQCIHRFHSVVTNLTREYDEQTAGLVQLQKELDASKQRNARLEKAVSKLHNFNQKLLKESKSNKSITRKLTEQLKSFRDTAARRKEEEDFYKLAERVQQHEQNLRERCDSNFSDVDGSVASSITTPSLVTDDGVVTLRIQQRERISTWPNTDRTTFEEFDNEVAKDEKPKSQALPRCNMDMNPFAQFFAPKEVQPYTLQFEAPFSLQFVALEAHTNQSRPNTIIGMEPPSMTETAFSVCGYHGFDSSVNLKPTLGARLLRINMEPVNTKWSIKELEGKIEAEGKTVKLTFRNDTWDRKQKEALRVAVQEQKRLYPIRVEAAPFLRIRAQSGDNAKQANNGLGFWNFHHQNATDQGSSEKTLIVPSMSDENNPVSKKPEEALSADHGSPLENLMSNLFKKNQNQETSLEESDIAEVPLRVGKVDCKGENDKKAVKVSESAQVAEDGTISSSTKSTNPNNQAEDIFKSSMKNMGKLFSFN